MEAGGVSRRDHRIAHMEVVAMLPGKAGNDDMAFLIRRPAMAFELGQSLEKGQGAKLERVQIERIVLRGHGSSGAGGEACDYSERAPTGKPGVSCGARQSRA